ncbi:hypothetical protein FOA52_011546 [Chlamydomonas sp. UWO 241]|nr:hypothetical protein FOA52_011546 [Chlamydomonas sp. UWO 241]
MLGSELRARESNLLKTQQQRLEKERQKLEKERLIAARQRQREEERENERAARRIEFAEAERKAQERKEELTEHNRGVYFTALLHVVPADEAAVRSRGIRRASDKVCLPPSAGADLYAQDASRNGALQFEIMTPGGASTHTGLLEFTAPEGTVLMPSRVADCLWGRERGEAQGPVTVTYKRLEKGTFVRFQPLQSGFHDAAGATIREVLEAALMTATTLTEGDVVRVDASALGGAAGTGANGASGPDADPGAGAEGSGGDAGGNGGPFRAAAAAAPAPHFFDLLVQELQPGCAVSLIDTEMEAQTETKLAAVQQQQEALRAARAEREAVALAQLKAQRDAQEVAAAEAAAEAAAAAVRTEVARASLEASLPPEPPATSADEAQAAGRPGDATLSAVLRLPDGARAQRRFRLADPPSLLFEFAGARGGGGHLPGTYRLVMQYPRRVLEPGSGGCLGDHGLEAGATEAVLVEPVSSMDYDCGAGHQ